jgi:hypothetical protein
MKIYITKKGVYVEQSRRCFTLGVGKSRDLVEGDANLAHVLRCGKSSIQKILNEKKYRGRPVRLATLGEVQAVYGTEVPVFDQTGTRRTVQAKPCKVTWRIKSKKYVSYYRSMLATKKAWVLDDTSFDRVLAKHPGWEKILPPGLVSIELHPPEKRLPSGQEFIGTDDDWQEMFDVSVAKNGRITLKPKQKTWSFSNRTDIPSPVAALIDWD